MEALQKLRRILLYAGASPEDYERIRPEIGKNNRTRLHVFLGVTIFFLSVMVVITYAVPGLGFSFLTYLAPLVLCAAILAADLCLGLRHPGLSRALIYLFILLLDLLAITVGTFANPTQTAGTFLAFLLVIPLLFVMRPAENTAFILLSDALFIMTAGLVKAPHLFYIDMINALVFGGISIIVSSFMMCITTENFVIKDAMTRLAQTDPLTGLGNRTAYEQALPGYPALCRQSLACVYVDANGLHELNNTRGHAAGDAMLVAVGAALRAGFGSGHTYRIGGDEYVAFAIDTTEKALGDSLAAFTDRITAQGYAVSVGYACCPVETLVLSDLIRSAEARMYADKQQYYANHPDRPHRRPR